MDPVRQDKDQLKREKNTHINIIFALKPNHFLHY